jgi:hypothetical protein
MKARRAISGASFDPDTIKMLCNVLDEVWASVSEDHGSDPKGIEAARLELATIIVGLARDHQLGALQIARTAARVMRERAGATSAR